VSLRGSTDPPSSQTPQWDPRWELTSEEFKSKCDDKTQQWLTNRADAIGSITVHQVLQMDWDQFYDDLKEFNAIRNVGEKKLVRSLFNSLHSQRAPQGMCE